MTAPIRFDQLDAGRQQSIQRNLSTLQQKGASSAEVEAYLRDVEHLAPTGSAPTEDPNAVHLNPVSGTADKFAKEATFGTMDRIIAGLGATHPLDAALGKGPLFNRGEYNAIKNRIDSADTEFGDQHGVLSATGSGAGMLAGGMLLPSVRVAQGASLVPRMLNAGANAGIFGTLSGIGHSDMQSGAQVARDALTGGVAGATVGAGLGAAAPYLAKPITAVVNKLNLRPSETSGVVQVGRWLAKQLDQVQPFTTVEDVARAKAGSVLPPDADILAKINDPAVRGKPITPLEIGGVPAQRALRGANVVSPAANANAAAALGQRAEGMPARMLDDLYDAAATGDRTPATATISQLVEQRAKDATPEYQAMWAQHNQPVTDPRVQEFFNTPTGSKVWSNTKSALADKRIAVATVQSQEMAPVTVPGKNGPVTLSNPDGSPILAPRKVQVEAPTPEQLHRAKLELDDQIKREYASVNNTPQGERGGSKTTRLRDLMGMRDQLVGIINDATNGRYNAVQAGYADDSQIIRAVEQGREHFTQHPDETQQLVAAMPPDAQAGYRRGAVDAARQVIEGPRPTQLLRGDAMQAQRIRQMFPNDATAQAFTARMGAEDEMRRAASGVLVGSNTAEKLNDAANVSSGAVVNALSGRPGGVVRSLARDAVNARSSAYNKRIAEALQPYLTAGATPDEMPLVDALNAVARQRSSVVPPSMVKPRLAGTVAGAYTARRQ